MKEVVIVSAVRSPIGSFMGSFQDIPAPKLAATCVETVWKQNKLHPEQIDECLMGCVLPAGLGQAPARQAAIYGGLPHSTRCTTINRVCGSGLKTAMMAAQAIQCDDAEIVIAGGMENMSQTPYLLPKARSGYRLGNGELVDSMVHDGLWDVYNKFHMGKAAELCASERKVTREQQDQFATQSYQRALSAISEGAFQHEIVPIEVTQKRQTVKVATDEEPDRGRLDKFPGLKPVFTEGGTVTAANASSLSDGAAALLICSAEAAQRHQLTPMARIVAQASFAQAPEWFTTAPVGSLKELSRRAKISLDQIDLFEINEAFAVVALACMQELNLDPAKVNVHGGAIALGHPLGASGARILVTLLHALERHNKRLGAATLCIGGGEASAILVERL